MIADLLSCPKAGFGYENSVSLQTDDAGHVGAVVLAHVACVVGLQTNDVRRNGKGLKFPFLSSCKKEFLARKNNAYDNKIGPFQTGVRKKAVDICKFE